MKTQNLNSSVAPFDTDTIIAMLAGLPGRDYELIARMASKLITKDTIDLRGLGNDLTLTDRRQMLGVSSDKWPSRLAVMWLIEEKGVHSPEYKFALERRLQLTRKAVLKGVKKIHDEKYREVFYWLPDTSMSILYFS